MFGWTEQRTEKEADHLLEPENVEMAKFVDDVGLFAS
jgi:hypothetical protein